MSLKKIAVSGLIWTYGQMFGSQLLSFGVSIILARLILPAEFGLIGMLSIFMGLGMALFNGGLTSSLIRSQGLTSEDYSTVFFFNLVGSVIVFIVLFLCAPFIANFYNQPVLENICRVYGISFVFSAFGAVQNTILIKEFQFKKIFILTLPALVISSFVAVIMASKGFGVWSLVASALVNTFCTSVFLWFASGWRPKLLFHRKKFNQHFNYGYKMTLSGILDIVYSNIYQIIIGKFYSAALVGYYTRANTLMMLPVANISSSLNTVVFPLFSKVQDDIPRFKSIYKQIMLMVLFIITPIMVLMGVLAEPLIIFLFTEKWISVVPIFRIICFTGVLFPIHSYNLMVLQAIGRSDLFLRLEVVKKFLGAVIIIISFYFGFYGLLWGQLVFSILALLINTHYAGQILKYKMWNQLRDMIPIVGFAVITFIAVYYTDMLLFTQGNFSRLIVGSVVGVGVYLGAAGMMKYQSLQDIKNIILKK